MMMNRIHGHGVENDPFLKNQRIRMFGSQNVSFWRVNVKTSATSGEGKEMNRIHAHLAILAGGNVKISCRGNVKMYY